MRIGNPVRSDLVLQYMKVSREKQKKLGDVVKQAPILFTSYPLSIVPPMRTSL